VEARSALPLSRPSRRRNKRLSSREWRVAGRSELADDIGSIADTRRAARIAGGWSEPSPSSGDDGSAGAGRALAVVHALAYLARIAVWPVKADHPAAASGDAVLPSPRDASRRRSGVGETCMAMPFSQAR
jgi:hypothetical protein